jgi:multiple sugar transport system ATP-binding protein
VSEIALDKVSKIYGDDTLAVHEMTLDIKDGEFMVFVGPSGCGKTTALRMVAGLEAISGGEVRIAGRVVNNVPPKDRDIAMVFQNYALYPHMSVRDNMAFGLKLAGVDKADIDRRVKEAARILGLDEFLNRKPRALSGGQRQRVAMGRAIVREPQAFLMDEPLSNLDAKLRVQMRAEIARIQGDLGVTTIYVTHDQVEAMTMGDRVAVIKKGELQQVGTPTELFDHPNSLFVAGFIGSPSMNFVGSKLERTNGKLQVQLGSQAVTLEDEVFARRPALKGFEGRDLVVGIRPQDFEDAALKGDIPTDRRLQAQIDLVEALGTETLVHFAIDAPIILTEDMKELAADIGGEQVEKLEEQAQEGRNQFVAQIDPKTRIKEHQEAELFVDTTQLHFFDPDTGSAVFD